MVKSHARTLASAGKRAVRPERPQERLLRQIVGVGRTRGHPREIPMNLAVMRRDNAFERVVTHHSAHGTPDPPACETAPEGSAPVGAIEA